MRLIAFGDIHMDWANLARVPRIDKADLLLISGDLTNFGDNREAATVLQAVGQVNSNFLALAGNLDQPEVNGLLADHGIGLHGIGRRYQGLGLMGLGGSNPTPFHTPNELSESELAALLAQGYEQVRDCGSVILVSHTPPQDTAADRLASGHHVGSSSVRDFIQSVKPALCVCGHIHEARAVDQLGPTCIINPGMLKDGGYIEITLTADGAVSAQLATL